MEKLILKPNIVKGIPVPLIRPLPTLYYFGQYFKENGSRQANKFFKGSIEYLANAIEILASEVGDNELSNIVKLTSALSDTDKNQIVNKVIEITTKLSNYCIKNNDKIKGNPKFSKENFAQIYKSKMQQLKILLIDNNNEPQRVNKLSETFRNTCYYSVALSDIHSDNFVDQINVSDFITFASAYPIAINEEIQNIQSYNKPCLVLADIKKDKKLDQQTLRNGAWLQSKGCEVLYKIFTPLRLFTTIDKIYMKYQFSNYEK